MKTIKYIGLCLLTLAFIACETDDAIDTGNNPLPALTAGTADFSTYVSIGNSLTAGFTDSALFIAAQKNSFPNTLSQKFALVGGSGTFTQPLMNDNIGGIAIGGTQIPGQSLGPRLVTLGGPPIPITSVIGPVVSSTDLLVNNPTGPFNNMGVPGAASFHFIAPGYGNIANLSAGLANPYFIRMTGSTPDATIMELTMAQSPSFVSVWVGANDVLAYALGGASVGAPTPQATFDFAVSEIMSDLEGTQGVMANIPNITDLPFFTTVPHNPIPLDAATAGAVNGAYATYNATLQALVDAPPVMMTQEEADSRMINFAEVSDNAVVIMDESLSDLTIYDPMLVSMRQATPDDLMVLSSSAFIGTEAQPGNPFSVNGVAIPLADQWVVTPSEQEEINMAINGFNATIQASASTAGFGFVDVNAIFQEMAATGYTDGFYTLTANLVTGGAVSLDGFHPTSRGYGLIANEMMKAIDVAYGSNFEASGNLLDIGDFPTNYSPLLQ